ncbi:MAG: YidC/Oxa1 family membrane protein insertase [Thermoleophilia bacterium]|nr:YidC/Oxa1 family membrane protein insertase [Thermoleophilia bacterium]
MTPLAGVLEPIEAPLSAVLEWLHASIGISWAWAIVVLTVIVRIVLVPLTVKQIRSMQRLQQYAPELKALQQKYKGDKQRLNEEVMKFYRENKVNPAASCLPVVFQIPIFISLFYVLRDFEKEVFPQYPGSSLDFLNGVVPSITAPVNEHWSGWMLLVVYVGSQLASTLLMSSTMDKTQRLLFLLMPFAFVIFIIRFPVGLMVYWVTTNLWTAGQGIVTRRAYPRTPVALPKRTSRTEPGAKPPAKAPAKKAAPKAKPAAAAAPDGAAGPGPRPVRRRKKRNPRARR